MVHKQAATTNKANQIQNNTATHTYIHTYMYILHISLLFLFYFISHQVKTPWKKMKKKKKMENENKNSNCTKWHTEKKARHTKQTINIGYGIWEHILSEGYIKRTSTILVFTFPFLCHVHSYDVQLAQQRVNINSIYSTHTSR